MKFCKRFEDKIFDYLEGSLPRELSKVVEGHFDSCPSCSSNFNEMKALKARLGTLQALKASADFETVLRARIRMERSLSRRSLFNRPIGIPIYAATGALIVLAAFLVLGPLTRDFRAGGSGERAILASPDIANQPISGFSITDSQNTQPGGVHYPMDWLPLSRSGTALNSQELERQSPTRYDSTRGINATEVRLPYEF